MSDRANLLISEILKRVHEVIVEHDVSYDEYQAAKQWFIDVGEAGEWPLFGDVYIEHVVEEHTFGNRSGSQGTILGPFHLPDAPTLEAPFELPRRPDEPGEHGATGCSDARLGRPARKPRLRPEPAASSNFFGTWARCFSQSVVRSCAKLPASCA